MDISRLFPSIIDEARLPTSVDIEGGAPSVIAGPVRIMKKATYKKHGDETNVTNCGNTRTIIHNEVRFNVRYELPRSENENDEDANSEFPKVEGDTHALRDIEPNRHVKAKMVSITEDTASLISLPVSDASTSFAHSRVLDTQLPGRRSRQGTIDTPGRRRSSLSSKTDRRSRGYIKDMQRKHLRLATIEHNIRVYMESDIGLGGRHTIPLWDPYPNMNLEPKLQRKHCSLGDVGIFRNDGGFDVLFNVFLSKEENLSMQYRPPPSFTPFEYEVLSAFKKPIIMDETCYFTDNFIRCPDDEISNCAYCFKSAKIPESLGGALLILPESGTAVTLNTQNVRALLQEYVDQHLASWYDLLNGSYNHRVRPNESLKMIHTCYKSKTWSAAALPRNAVGADSCKAKLNRSAVREGCYKWEADKSFRVSQGSSHPLMQTFDSEYTVAVEVFTLVQGPKPSQGLLSSVIDRSGALLSRASLRLTMSRTVTSLARKVTRL